MRHDVAHRQPVQGPRRTRRDVFEATHAHLLGDGRDASGARTDRDFRLFITTIRLVPRALAQWFKPSAEHKIVLYMLSTHKIRASCG